jgi:hypothetical protein
LELTLLFRLCLFPICRFSFVWLQVRERNCPILESHGVFVALSLASNTLLPRLRHFSSPYPALVLSTCASLVRTIVDFGFDTSD